MDDLVGLMRLSRKYQAEALYKHCITVFQNAWPPTLSDFARRNADLMRIWNEQEACSAQDDNTTRWGERLDAIPDPGMFTHQLLALTSLATSVGL